MSEINEGSAGAHHQNLMWTDREAAQPEATPITSWGDAVRQYKLSPQEQDDFLCFLKAHGHPTAQMDPALLHALYTKWRGFEEQRESRVTRDPGQLSWDAMTEGYFLTPDEQDAFFKFIEENGLKKTERLPVLEAAFQRFKLED